MDKIWDDPKAQFFCRLYNSRVDQFIADPAFLRSLRTDWKMYTNIMRLMGHIFEQDPTGAVLAFRDLMRDQIVMPSHLMEDGAGPGLFESFSTVAQQLGVYTAKHYAEIVKHLVRRWDVEHLAGLTGEVERRLRSLESVVSVDSELERAENEIWVLINREQARKQGLRARDVGQSIAYQLRGARLPRFQTDEREISVRLFIREEDRETLTQLKNLSFATGSGEEVALSTFATFQ